MDGQDRSALPAASTDLAKTVEALRGEIQERIRAEDELRHERRTLHQLLRVSDYERQLVAYEIHDGLAQFLAAAIMQLQSYLDKIPKHQDDLKTLERNYAMASLQVDFYRAQLNKAQQANDLESEGMGPSYEIKDPPRMPTSPSGPKFVKYAVFGAFLGGAMAAGIIFLFVLLDGSLRSVEEARGVLRMPILGMMQQIVSPAQESLLRRRRRGAWIGVGAAAAALIAVVAVGYFRYHDDLLLGMDNLRDYLKRR